MTAVTRTSGPETSHQLADVPVRELLWGWIYSPAASIRDQATAMGFLTAEPTIRRCVFDARVLKAC